MDGLPERSLEDTLYDCDGMEEVEEEESSDVPQISAVVCEDVIGVPASIIYHSSLQQLVQHLQLPVYACTKTNHHTNRLCGAPKPFEVVIQAKGTAAVVEWVCL